MTNVNRAEFEGKVAIVTGAASGIGRAARVTNFIFLVRVAAAAIHIQVKLSYPPSCHQG
jgi:hypothetical protein